MGDVLIPAWILAPPTVVSADVVTNSPPMEDHAMISMSVREITAVHTGAPTPRDPTAAPATVDID
jgi:hypothetical protein